MQTTLEAIEKEVGEIASFVSAEELQRNVAIADDKPISPGLGRIVELDSIRGLAALAVLFCHLPRGFWFGETGVDLFFVLSGYLITGIILSNLQKPHFLRVFYWRRSLRIFPIFYLALVVIAVLSQVRPTPDPLTGMPYYFAYVQNIQQYWGGETPPSPFGLGHTWTLAIEEQFYLFWPAAVLLVGRRRLPWMCGFFIALPVFLRAFGLPRTVLFGHTDGLALGGLLAWVAAELPSLHRSHRKKAAGVYALLPVIGLAIYFGMWSFSTGTGKQFLASNPAIVAVSLAYFGAIGATICLSGTPWLSPLRIPFLAATGTISYGLYLYHWPIYELVDMFVKFRWHMGEPWWSDVLKVFLSFTVAIISWRLIEKPLLRFKDQFAYGQSAV